jgi:hypothetical protein
LPKREASRVANAEPPRYSVWCRNIRRQATRQYEKCGLGTLEEIQHVLEAAGAEFIERGVRQRAWTPEEIEARYQRITAIAKRSAERFKDAPPFTEDDLYDENGLPA